MKTNNVTAGVGVVVKASINYSTRGLMPIVSNAPPYTLTIKNTIGMWASNLRCSYHDSYLLNHTNFRQAHRPLRMNLFINKHKYHDKV